MSKYNLGVELRSGQRTGFLNVRRGFESTTSRDQPNRIGYSASSVGEVKSGLGVVSFTYAARLMLVTYLVSPTSLRRE